MAKTIVQTVDFEARPEVLFALYANSKKHAAAIGASARISGKAGGPCEAWDGYMTGTTLGVVKNRVFVQSWRAADWGSEVADSLLTLFFEKRGNGGRVTMVHANVPESQYAGIKAGWTEYYWKPWKKCLSVGSSRKGKQRKN
jgi:activator of HSP90 ATPase